MTHVYHVYTSKNYVLRKISSVYNRTKKWSTMDILIFKNNKSHIAKGVSSYDELVKLLEEYEKVYSFREYKDVAVHGAHIYDIILEEA